MSRETGQHDRMVYLTSNEPMIVKLQSHWKGYLTRKAYKERMTFIHEQLPAIIKIQVSRGKSKEESSWKRTSLVNEQLPAI